MKKDILNIAFLISGSGTTAQAAIEEAQKNDLAIKPAVVIADRPAPGLVRAECLGIPTELVIKSEFANNEDFGEALLALLVSKYDIDVVMQCGWLSFTPENVIERFPGNIINQHPASLDAGRPDFGGKGMYGLRAITARLLYLALCRREFGFDATEMWTEATTHFATRVIDGGQIIRTERLSLVEILPKPILVSWAVNDDLLIKFSKKVQAMLLPLEHHNIIETLRLVVAGKALGSKREQPLIVQDRIEFLEQAKKSAIKLYKEKQNGG